MRSLETRFTEALRAALGPVERASLHEPLFEGKERAYLLDCIDSTFVSSVGPYVDRFEKDLAAFTGAGSAVAVVNGTAGLVTALRLCDVRPGDEVLVPALTFVATANAVVQAGAHPCFVDCEGQSLGVDPDKLAAWLEEECELREGSCYRKVDAVRVGALLVVHVFGQPANIGPLAELCARWTIPLVEDCAESLGSYFGDRHTGCFGRAGVLSFNGNKVITTGGGGAVLTEDLGLGKRAKFLTTTAKEPHPWRYIHSEMGYNFRMPNVNAALGCAQLENLPRTLERKRLLADRYRAALDGVQGLRFLEPPPWGTTNHWLNAVVLDEAESGQLDAVLKAAHSQGLLCRPVWELMHRLPMYSAAPRMDLSCAEGLAARVINLPSSEFL
jgi:perosamine synthetase